MRKINDAHRTACKHRRQEDAIPIQIGQRVDHGFDEPLGLLSDCHRRIEHFLRVLATVAEAPDDDLSASYRSALEGAIRYFAVAAPKHTADEEVSLFPRLRRSGDPAAASALALLDNLERDHDEAEAHHAAVEDLVKRWLADGRLTKTDRDHLRERLARLQAIYEWHIAIEDREVFPAAARALSAAETEAIAREMAARRHLSAIRRAQP